MPDATNLACSRNRQFMNGIHFDERAVVAEGGKSDEQEPRMIAVQTKSLLFRNSKLNKNISAGTYSSTLEWLIATIPTTERDYQTPGSRGHNINCPSIWYAHCSTSTNRELLANIVANTHLSVSYTERTYAEALEQMITMLWKLNVWPGKRLWTYGHEKWLRCQLVHVQLCTGKKATNVQISHNCLNSTRSSIQAN